MDTVCLSGYSASLAWDYFNVETTLSFGDEHPAAVAAVVDTGAGQSVVGEDMLPSGWRAPAWRVPTGTPIVDA